MKRTLPLVALMLILGAAGHHTARCHTVWGVARVCNASGGAPRATREDARRFAVRLLARWNARAAGHGFPADLAACTPYPPPDGESFYACVWRVWWPTLGRFRCRVALLDTGLTEWRGEWEQCRGLFAPKAGAA